MHPEQQSPRLQRLPLRARLAGVALACAGAVACSSRAGQVGRAPASDDGGASPRGAASGAPDASGGGAQAGDAGALDAGAGVTSDDGDDDPEDPGTGAAPAPGTARFEKVGTPPLALTRICDLTPFHGALYAAHANQPLGTDGATITRYSPKAAKPFTVAFDWNRPGEPVKGGGGGQGFVRVHAIGGRLYVPDADPPYGGLGIIEGGTEGYVFVSDANGTFAPPRAPHYRPPAFPDLLDGGTGKAGAGVLPRAYHVLDVARFRGALYASTGSVPPKEQAWRGPSPGALHRASDDGTRWTYEVDYPFPYQNGTWRLTYMVRFKDRLYAGIQDYDGRDPHDYLYFALDRDVRATPGADLDAGADAGPSKPPPPMLRREHIEPVRVTPTGAAGTLRWWVDQNARRLYWIAWSRGDGINLRATTDGDTWTLIPMPPGAGRPTDITRFRDRLVVLTERALYRLDTTGTAIDPTPLASVDAKEKKSPFEVSDFFCVAPLAVLDDTLYLGGQRGGTLFKLADAPPP